MKKIILILAMVLCSTQLCYGWHGYVVDNQGRVRVKYAQQVSVPDISLPSGWQLIELVNESDLANIPLYYPPIKDRKNKARNYLTSVDMSNAASLTLADYKKIVRALTIIAGYDKLS